MPIFSVSRSQNRFLKKGERYALSEKKIRKIEMAEASNHIPLAVIAVCQFVIHSSVAPASRAGRLLEFGPIETTRSIRQIHFSLS